MNTIGAALTCQTPPQSFTDQLAQGKTKTHNVAIGANTKSLQIALTWSSPLDTFAISGLKLVNHGSLVGATYEGQLICQPARNRLFQ